MQLFSKLNFNRPMKIKQPSRREQIFRITRKEYVTSVVIFLVVVLVTDAIPKKSITCVICSTFMMCGCARTFVSYLVAHLSRENEEWRNGIQLINTEQASWLCSLSPLTNPIGFLLGGYVMDVFGRKCSVTGALFPFVIGWAIIFKARNLNDLYVAGVLHGIASGMSMTASAYISEISSPRYRGFFLSILPLSYMLGTVICSALVCLFGWLHGAAYLLALSIIMWATAFLIPESPYWLVLKGCTNAAIKVLESIRRDSDVIKDEILDIKKCAPHEYYSSNVFSIEPHTKPPKASTLKALWDARKQIAMLTTLAILHKFTGFTPLAQYTVHFFQELHTPLDSETAPFVHTMVCFASTFAVPYFVHNFDKRPLLCVTSVIAGLSMSLVLVSELNWSSDLDRQQHNWLALVGVYSYDVFITIGITSILVMLPAELLPTEISGIACAIFSILCSIITAVIVKTYLSLFAFIGLCNMLSTFIICCFIVAIFSVTILPETRGKTLTEIQETYFNGDSAPVPAVANGNITITKNKALSKLTTSSTILPI